MGVQVYDEHAVQTFWSYLDITDGLTPSGIASVAGAGTRVDHVLLTSNAAIAHDVALIWATDPGVTLCTVTVPAGAGFTAGVPPVDLLSALPASMTGLSLKAGDRLSIALLVALDVGETLCVIWFGGDF